MRLDPIRTKTKPPKNKWKKHEVTGDSLFSE